ncbi:MAG: hypothetical protein FJZ60_03270 [Chlamydiae bacterium]|nr:hypothetical protein [Chlamydiota bacterium]
MSVGPTPPNEWSNITSDLEKASKEATTAAELNKKIHDIFQKNKLPDAHVLDETIRHRLKAVKDNTRLPFREILAANTLLLKVEQAQAQKFQKIERRFKLLKENYPVEFEVIIRRLKDKHGIQSDIQSFKELILNIYLSNPNPTIEDLLGTDGIGRYDIDKLEAQFFSQIYDPLVAYWAREKRSRESVGLRDKRPEIQAKFLEGKSRQTEFIKQQYQKKESFENIFKNSCSWRSDLAVICLDPDAILFGELRTKLDDNARGSGGLISGFKVCKAPQELIEKCETLTHEKPDQGENWPFPKQVRANHFQRTIYGENIPLTRLNLLGSDETEFKQISERYGKFSSRYPGLRHRHSWTHTEPRYINQCMSHIDALYQELLEATSPDQKLNLIARIHWWGCQACPCARGSAAIMEVICQGLLEGSKFPFRLDPKKPVDIYALTEPDENQFVKDYVSLLQSTELD